MSTAESAFVVCNDGQLATIIAAARRRLGGVAPALNMAVAEAVSAVWRELGRDAVAVILDSDPEVYRLGYGVPEALDRLLEVARDLQATVRRQPGLRIGLIIADDETIVYSPVPQLIEAGPNTDGGGATAIRLTALPGGVAVDLGLNSGDCARIGREPFDEDAVNQVKDDLAKNPPKKFDVARTERVFNAAFEFVDFELLGAAINRKKVKIPSELIGLARDEHTRRLMDTTFRLIDDDDELSGSRLHDMKTRIIKTYLTSLPGYGSVVLRNVKPQFERRVKQLKCAVQIFQKMVAAKLQTAMDKNREALVKALLPAVIDSPPKSWLKYGPLTVENIERLLSGELADVFGTASDLVGEMRVNVVYKGVTYQSLIDPGFQAVVKERLPFLAATHEEHTAAPERAERAQQSALFG